MSQFKTNEEAIKHYAELHNKASRYDKVVKHCENRIKEQQELIKFREKAVFPYLEGAYIYLESFKEVLEILEGKEV